MTFQRAIAVTLAAGLALTTACGGGPNLEETPPPQPAEFEAEEDSADDEAGDRIMDAARPTYRVYVANESSDDVNRVAFTPGEGLVVEDTISVGVMPGDIDGAHGITVSPDGSRWYVTIAHGTPYGSMWQFATGSDTLVARTELGRFPATMGITPDGSMMLVANFNLHGDPVASDISVVFTPTMTEMARVPTCVTPHGSRVSPDGTRHYSVCTGSEQLVEIDTRSFEVTRRLSVAPGRERPLPLSDRGEPREEPERLQSIEPAPDMQQTCSPTWAEPATGTRAGERVYVTCNGNQEVLAVSTERWEVVDRYPTGSGPYNLEITPNGRFLIATLRGDQAISIFDLDADGEEVARLETSESMTHGVVASPDNRYVFVTNESVGATSGTLDVFDLEAMERVATVELGHQSGGIDFWETSRLGR